MTLGHIDGYPYPSLRVRVLVVRVLAGKGRGIKKKPEGYPGHTLLTRKALCKASAACCLSV
jgi:hypothetical protein